MSGFWNTNGEDATKLKKVSILYYSVIFEIYVRLFHLLFYKTVWNDLQLWSNNNNCEDMKSEDANSVFLIQGSLPQLNLVISLSASVSIILFLAYDQI